MVKQQLLFTEEEIVEEHVQTRWAEQVNGAPQRERIRDYINKHGALSI